ncbi:MAG: prepilin-type N-terminal cleavage/methylation domain-containing protein [Acidobacteriota bacterium]|nr:prepilin-type N-terminal cleavage/methylation domain-containing protein [Acidobacteriota bacterium]
MNTPGLRRSIRQRGYSLPELLVVVAVVGIFSMVAIPALINYTRMAAMRTGLRAVTMDLRAARTRAITTGNPITVNISGRTYSIGGRPRPLDKNLYFDETSMTGFTFMPNGSVRDLPTSGSPGIHLRSRWTNLPRNHYKIEVTLAGSVRSTVVTP